MYSIVEAQVPIDGCGTCVSLATPHRGTTVPKELEPLDSIAFVKRNEFTR